MDKHADEATPFRMKRGTSLLHCSHATSKIMSEHNFRTVVWW